jgi:hypothetical protein
MHFKYCIVLFSLLQDIQTFVLVTFDGRQSYFGDYCLFYFCGLFNEALSVSRLHSFGCYDNALMMRWKGFGMKRSWSSGGSIPEFDWRGWEKRPKPQSW